MDFRSTRVVPDQSRLEGSIVAVGKGGDVHSYGIEGGLVRGPVLSGTRRLHEPHVGFVQCVTRHGTILGPIWLVWKLLA